MTLPRALDNSLAAPSRVVLPARIGHFGIFNSIYLGMVATLELGHVSRAAAPS